MFFNSWSALSPRPFRCFLKSPQKGYLLKEVTMPVWRGWDKIKYEAPIGTGLCRGGGLNSRRVKNCSTASNAVLCSGLCPLSTYMDFTPRRIIAMIRAGFKREVLSSQTCWLCASCYACTVECPKEVKITDIMYATKRLAIREGVYPKRFAIPVLAREFFSAVENHGPKQWKAASS